MEFDASKALSTVLRVWTMFITSYNIKHMTYSRLESRSALYFSCVQFAFNMLGVMMKYWGGYVSVVKVDGGQQMVE